MATKSRRVLRVPTISNLLRRIKNSRRYQRVTAFVQKKPFTSFFTALGILLLVLILGTIITHLGRREEKKATPIKKVQTYIIGKTPTVALQAQVKKHGVIQIVAQGPGIVQKIHVTEGDTVKQGQWLVSLSTNYQGGSAPALQAQLARVQLKNVKDTYALQKDIIGKQRDIATASAENTEQLRLVSEKSLHDTRDLLGKNQTRLNEVNDQIALLEATDPTNANLPTLKAQQVQLESGIAQLASTVRTLEYQTNSTNPPTLLSNTQKEFTLKQLDVQEKALYLNKQVSQIQYSLALVQEGIMHPAAPFAGTVQRVNVQVGENVNPGTVIATLSGTDITTTAMLHVPGNIANSLSRVEPSILHINDTTVSVVPSYISSVATTGQLYSVIYSFPDGAAAGLTDGEYISVDVPVGYAASNGIEPFVPIDSVYESQDESTVYIVKDKKAQARKIKLGDVYGQYVAVKQGLNAGDQIILDRNVVAGDSVTASQ